MKHIKINFVVMTVLCSFAFLFFGICTNEASAAESLPTETWDVSENPGTDSVIANLYKINENLNLYFVQISGVGRMKDFSFSSPAPWIDNYSDYIIRASVGGEVTYIGSYAFYGCTELESLTVYNPSLSFYIMADTVLPSYSTIRAHEISTAHEYAKLIYPKPFDRICEFADAVCTICGYECTSHKGGEANCEDRAKCEECGSEYGSALGHAYSEWNPVIIPDCELYGVRGHYECTRCGKYFDSDYKEWQWIYISPLGHSYGELIPAMDAGCSDIGWIEHYECSVCGKYFDAQKNEIEYVWIGALGHTGGVADCTQPCVCDRCGEKYGNKNTDKHNFSLNPSYDTEFHWYECPCGEKQNISPHIYKFEVTKEPSGEEEGIRSIFCDCGYEKHEVIEKLKATDEDNTKTDESNHKWFPVAAVIAVSVIFAAGILTMLILLKRKQIKF